MEQKNLNLNETAKKEMEEILWSASNDSNDTKDSNDLEKSIDETNAKIEVENKPNDEVTIEEKATSESDDKEANNITDIKDAKPKNKKKTDKKPKDPNQTSNKQKDGKWAASIPEEERFTTETILHFKRDQYDKIGNFLYYGKKDGVIWVDMFKKDSTEHMSRPWSITMSDCTIVENKGVLNPNYVKENGIYYTKEEYEALKNDNK